MAQIPPLLKKKAFLFDYGDTLVKYYKGVEFHPILRESITKISEFFTQSGIPQDSLDTIWKRALRENYESKDYCVRPLTNRLIQIFQLNDPNKQILERIQELFIQPIYSVAKLFDDAIPTLKRLKNDLNVKIAIVSNTPWGSPSNLWNKELSRFKLDSLQEYIDISVFCVDVGWRKPASSIFQYILDTLHVCPDDCVFIGDNPKWDVEGPQKMNIDAILLDRNQKYTDLNVPRLKSLDELFEFI